MTGTTQHVYKLQLNETFHYTWFPLQPLILENHKKKPQGLELTLNFIKLAKKPGILLEFKSNFLKLMK